MKATLTGKSRALLLTGLAGLLLFVAPKAQADESDPPSRVARISDLDGNVSFQPSGTEDWAAAAKNRPVTVGDKLWTDQDSRAELQTGQASLHLGSMTALSFLNLDEDVTQVRIAEGALNFRVREMREGDLYEVDTPNLAFTVKEAGAFRIDVNENGDGTRVTVIRGEGEVSAGGKTYVVYAGEQAELNGVDNPEFNVERAPDADDLDRWAADRDLKEERSKSARYVSRDVPGYSDLDDYGSWREEPEYGPVWYPTTVAVGWAPYSYGYWNWVGPWGWTWVDYEPWGFAPFHYGRWAYVGGGWGWCPGPVYERPFYGPAFVGFVGGGGFGVGFGGGWGGGIGWFPLGWGEPYHPWYHTSNVYVRNVNITNTRITNVNVLNSNHNNFNYAYAHNVRAVTAASRNAFVNGQSINRGSMHVTEASLRGAHVSNGTSFTPNKASFTGAANARGSVSTPPSSVSNRAVVARTAPGAAASHIPVRTMNTQGLSAGRGSGNAPANAAGNRAGNSGMSQREGQLSNNQPPSASAGVNGRASVNGNGNVSNNRPPSANAGMNGRASVNGAANGASNVSPNRPANGSRSWSAQGNATDNGRAPQGFGGGSSNRASNGVSQSGPAAHSDRPPWVGGSSSRSMPATGSGPNSAGSRPSSPTYSNGQSNGGNRSYEPQSRPSSPSYNSNRPSYSNGGNPTYQPPSRPSAPSYNNNRPSYSNGGGRSNEAPSRPSSPPPSSSNGNNRRSSYEPPSRSYSPPSSYSGPSPSYSASSRSYSPPSRSYSAPTRSYSAPSYSAPSRSYSAPSRSYSAPGPSYGGGGGGSYHGGGGGGGSHNSGGGSRGSNSHGH
jgi:hypothetical protein